MSSASLIYKNPHVYELLMRTLYGRHYVDRMRAVAEQVPQGSSVLELCCGPGTLYNRFLRGKTSSYIGVDVNERFVSDLRKDGIDARRIDLADDDQPLPPAETVMMQASLYHFLPHAERVLERMLDAATERVIISEPIRNLASSNLPIIGAVGQRAADPGVGGHADRFDEATLDQLMSPYRELVTTSFQIPGGREKVYVLRAR
ncbi:MAG: class I SAM-dependent methyltransferase [Solirubrobacterales bacterium]|nr:class I SAM-dependent methyltransferase [Solirubrobacterales bacterium]